MRSRKHSTKIKSSIEGKKMYKPLKYPNIPFSISDIYIITTSGDRVDSLAQQFYNDIRLWWIITTANKDIIGRDSFGIKPGLEIRIPGNVSGILNLFERINK